MNFAEEATPPNPSKNARKRMLRDIIEWNEYSNECPMITAAPMQENIFEWHINMNATSGVLKNIIIHLIATFPSDYPQQPPVIRVCSFFPHPNVFHAWYYYWNNKWIWARDKEHYWICLDMIHRYKDENAHDRQVVLDSYHGWSAAYSVTSVLLQLSSFLYEDKSSYYSSNTGKQIKGKKGMKIESQEFSCIKCGHSYKVPYPPLNAFRPNKGQIRRVKKREYKQKQKEEALEYITKQIEGVKHTCTYDDEDLDEKIQLQVLSGRYNESMETRRLRNRRRNTGKKKELIKKCDKNMWSFLYYDVERLIISCLSLRDLMKLATVSLYHQKLIENTKILQIHRFGCWYHRVDLSFHNELLKIRGKFHGWNEQAMINLKSKSNESNRQCYNLTLGYGIIPTFYDGNTSFGSHIHHDDLSAMQRAEDALRSMNQSEGKQMDIEGNTKKKKKMPVINLPERFSREALDFPLLKEVKATFDLLSSDAYLNHNIHTTPWNDQSFHNFIPIYINDNHGKRALECVEEFVLQCYMKHDSSVQTFHPLMAIHLIANIMNSLVVHLMQKFETDNTEKLAKKGQFAYNVVTDAFNTGRIGGDYWDTMEMNEKQKEKNVLGLNLHYSINVLESYFHFHHLLLGIYKKYYSILQPVVENKCTNFINNSEYRMKKYVPNLGEMMVWLTLNNMTWDKVCPALLDELFVRHVKWVLQECPQLFKISNKQSCIRLRKTFDHSTTSLRLYMFQYFFLKSCCEIGTISPMDKLEEYNDNFGCPPAELPYELQKWCRKIYKVTDWIGFFEMIDIACPSAKSLCKWLEYSIIESDNRGYHKNCDVNLLSELKNIHYQNTIDINKLFSTNQLNDKYCICSGEINGLPEIEIINTNNEGSVGKSKRVVYADIVIKKYIGYHQIGNKKYILRPYSEKVSDLQKDVNRLINKLGLNIDNRISNIRYKLIISNHSEYYIDGTKWYRDLNACFELENDDEDDVKLREEQWRKRAERGFYLWDKDAQYYYDMMEQYDHFQSKYFKITHNDYGWIGKAHEWRPAAQKYIIDLDILECENNNNEKPLILPFCLLNTNDINDKNYFELNKNIKSDDIIYYITIPQILNVHNIPWNKWLLTPYSVNLNGLINELESIYKSFSDRKSLPIIAELFEKFKKRNPNLAANAHATDIFKFFKEDCQRGRKKNKIISKHFPGSLVWYKPHYKSVYNEKPKIQLTETYEEYNTTLTRWEGSEYVRKKIRLNTKYSSAMYCGEIIKFHEWIPDPINRPKYKELFYQIKPINPLYIPTDYIEEQWLATDSDMKKYNYKTNPKRNAYKTNCDSDSDCDNDLDENGNKLPQQKHVAIQQYAAIAISDALICTIMSQKGYNLNISEILPYHMKNNEIKPINNLQNELNFMKQQLNSTADINNNEEFNCKLMNKYLNKRRRLRIDKFGETEIIQFAIYRKDITQYIYKEKFQRSIDFMKAREKTENWDDFGCVYRNKEYSTYYANTRGAIKYENILPILEIPKFDPFANILPFLTKNNFSPHDPNNLYNKEFDSFPIQAYDKLTHRWFNGKILSFESLSAIIIYDEWDKYVFKDKISLCSNNLIPYNTYLINDNKIGYIDYNKGPNNYINKDYIEEYESKQKKQKRFDDKFKLLNDEYYHKYFFEAVADNNIKIVKQLLSVGTEKQHEEKQTIKQFNDNNNNEKKSNNNNNNKWTTFNWNESDDESENDINNNRFTKLLSEDKISDTEWLKWMNRKIDVNMTDINGRTPLFVCSYNGYYKMCKLLIKYNIDVNIIDLYGQTALDAANNGLNNAKTENKRKQLNQIINLLKENMKSIKEGDSNIIRPGFRPNVRNDNNNNININPGNESRKYVSNNEIIWTSSLIYVGNLPWNMNENEIKQFVKKYYIKPLQVIKKKNFTLIKTREDLKKLNKKICKMNGIFFRGAMITVNLFQQQRKNNNNNNNMSSKTRSLNDNNNNNEIETENNINPGGNIEIQNNNYNNQNTIKLISPNRALFVNNFDVIPGIYDNLNKIFIQFGNLQRQIQIGIDKFGDPYAKIIFNNLEHAINAYENANNIGKGITIGLRILKVEYSKFTPKPIIKYNNNFNNNTYDGYYERKSNNIRPKNVRPLPIGNNNNNNNYNNNRGKYNRDKWKPKQYEKKQNGNNNKNNKGDKREKWKGKKIVRDKRKQIKPKKSNNRNNNNNNSNKNKNMNSNDNNNTNVNINNDGWIVKGSKNKNKKGRKRNK